MDSSGHFGEVSKVRRCGPRTLSKHLLDATDAGRRRNQAHYLLYRTRDADRNATTYNGRLSTTTDKTRRDRRGRDGGDERKVKVRVRVGRQDVARVIKSAIA